MKGQERGEREREMVDGGREREEEGGSEGKENSNKGKAEGRKKCNGLNTVQKAQK